MGKGLFVDDYARLNTVLVRLFRNILDFEASAILNTEFKDISLNDVHVMEAIGIGERKNMSSIASALNVTMGSLTIAMNGLLRKGYVKRERGEKDRRVVFIELSEKGRRAYEGHMDFHREMVHGMLSNLTPQEIEAVTNALSKIDIWMQKSKTQK